MPPAALIACTPAEPSVPVPDRITPMALLPHSSASDRRKRSMGMCDPGVCVRGASFSVPSCDGQIGVGRYDVYVVRLHRHAIGRLTDRHGGGSRKNLGQHAGVIGIEMLNEDDGKAGVGGQIGEQPLEDFQSARGGADAGHRDARPFRHAQLRPVFRETVLPSRLGIGTGAFGFVAFGHYPPILAAVPSGTAVVIVAAARGSST